MIGLMLLAVGAMAETPQRTISVQGEGAVEYVPDRARLRVSIVARSAEVTNAQAEAADVVAKVLEMADRLGLEREAVDTTAANVRPEYRWNRQREEQELIGYLAERSMTISVKSMDLLGELIEGSVAAGVNQVQAPELYSSRSRELYREALAAAAEDARRNATALAEALGAELGDVVTVSTHGAVTPRPMPQARMAMQADATEAAETYQAGERSHRTRVSVVFGLR